MILFFGFLFSLFSTKHYSGGGNSDETEWEFQGDDEPDEWEKQYRGKYENLN
jgi:hypothetical protein